MNYQLVTTNQALHDRCEKIRKHPYVAIDTEFVRKRTYYPQLGLIQLYAGGRTIILIDPITITDWKPFVRLLKDQEIIKLLHACGEDLEIFWHSFGQIPTPIIDTQVLAAFTGRSISCGFASLAEEVLGVILNKTASRTNWLARPLNKNQCDYAAADVYWLLPIALHLIMQTRKAGWWLQAVQECKEICCRRQKAMNLEYTYLNIPRAQYLHARQLACLQKLVSWRLSQARDRDIAVNCIVQEAHLLQIARCMPESLHELEKIGLDSSKIRLYCRALLKQVQEAKFLSEIELPRPILGLTNHTSYKTIFKKIKEEIKVISNNTGLSSELLASRRQINELIWALLDVTNSVNINRLSLMNGWRKAFFKEKLLSLFSKYRYARNV